jgi:hypothetical protein
MPFDSTLCRKCLDEVRGVPSLCGCPLRERNKLSSEIEENGHGEASNTPDPVGRPFSAAEEGNGSVTLPLGKTE